MKFDTMYFEDFERFTSIEAPRKSFNRLPYTLKNFRTDMTLPQIPINAPIKISNPDT